MPAYTPKDGDAVLPLFSLKGKTAIVTGAGAGIGFAVANAFAEAGADLALWYRTNEKTPARAEEIAQKYGVKCKAYKVDVRVQKEVEETTDLSVKELGGTIDIFIANAGIPWTKGAVIEANAHDHYHDVVKSDLDSVYFSAHAVGKYFKKQGSGSFVATASMSGWIVNIPQLQAAYNAAKAGVVHLCRSLAVEWAAFARVNTISPGYIATEISDFVPKETKDIWKGYIPVHREGLANELKGGYLYLASDASSYVTGTDLKIDGGYCAP